MWKPLWSVITEECPLSVSLSVCGTVVMVLGESHPGCSMVLGEGYLGRRDEAEAATASFSHTLAPPLPKSGCAGT